jgi:hypothetical protein
MISSSTVTLTDRLGSANNTALLNSLNELNRPIRGDHVSIFWSRFVGFL